MNERIRQLVRQAGWDGYEALDERNQKFAQLIVRECGVALSPMLRDMVSRGQAFNLIKQHFGVKE